MSLKRKSIQTITDEALEPFFITKDEYSFSVKQNVTSDASHFRSKGNSKTYEKTLYYCPTFGAAIAKIADLKSDTGDYSSLSEYLENYKLVKNQIKNYTDGIKSAV